MKQIIFFFTLLLICCTTSLGLNSNTRSYVWNNSNYYTGTINKDFLGTCSLTGLGATGFYPGASVFAGNTLYTVKVVPDFELYRVDTLTGAHTLVAHVTNVPFSLLTGIAWDPTTNTMFAMATSTNQSQLGTINLTTGAMTLIGSAQG